MRDGFLNDKCPACRGAGWRLDWLAKDEVDCGVCDGLGKVECAACLESSEELCEACLAECEEDRAHE